MNGMTMRPTLLLVLVRLACSQAVAGSPFEVASVKADPNWRPGGPGTKVEVVPGSVRMHNVSLARCISWAYSLLDYQIVGLDWIRSERPYDIAAKTSGAEPEAQLRLKLRDLLVERFSLSMHREAREFPVYALISGRGGIHLRESDGSGEVNKIMGAGPYTWKAERTTLMRLAEILGPPWMSLPVLDQTGIEGEFDFKLDLSKYVLDPETGRPVLDNGKVDMESALMRALPEQLGLGLRRTKAPIEVLVIDHAERVPTDN
jgi:uncharacterized protein (TIGR03435 family)